MWERKKQMKSSKFFMDNWFTEGYVYVIETGAFNRISQKNNIQFGHDESRSTALSFEASQNGRHRVSNFLVS